MLNSIVLASVAPSQIFGNGTSAPPLSPIEAVNFSQVQEGHLIADNKADFLERLKTIVEEQQDEVRRQQLEDVEEDVIEQDSAVKVEEPTPTAEPEVEVTEPVTSHKLDETEQTRTRLTSLNLGSEASASSLTTDKVTDDYFDLSSSPRDFSFLRDYVSFLLITCQTDSVMQNKLNRVDLNEFHYYSRM